MLDWLFGKGAQARTLNRDAASIVTSTRLGRGANTQRAMALATRSGLRDAHERGGPDLGAYKPILDHFKVQHREARRAHDEVKLTSCTLCIIYLRSEQLGDVAAPARATIDEFLAEWAHVEDDTVQA